jgi:hypothetical protein
MGRTIIASSEKALMVNREQVREVAHRLLESLKGIERARVQVDERGMIVGVELLPKGIDDRAAMRNAQSALMAVLGQNVDINAMAITPVLPVSDAPVKNVVEFKSHAPKASLTEAARAAFDMLRAAQSSFHGFQFEGAELVGINGQQYVVVALRRGEFKFSGSAPVLRSVGNASARAMLHAVSVAAMDATHLDLSSGDFEIAAG